MTILKTIENLHKLGEGNYHFERVLGENDNEIKFIDKDENSDFYFYIYNFQISTRTNQLVVDVKYKPTNLDHLEPCVANIKVSQLEGLINTWNKIIGEFNQIAIFDKPLIKQYQEEFFTNFEFENDEIKNSPYDFNTQLFIDKYLEFCLLQIDKYYESSKAEDFEILKLEIIDLRENQTEFTRQQVAKRLSKILAYSRKIGLKLSKVLVEKVIEVGVNFVFNKYLGM